MAQCEEGFYAKDKKIYTSDCDNECLESVCAKCKPCADGKTCPAGEIAESRACDESLGDECNECGCDGKWNKFLNMIREKTSFCLNSNLADLNCLNHSSHQNFDENEG